MVIDTHAGAGLYRLDDHFAQTSGEAADGITKISSSAGRQLAPVLVDYLAAIAQFNAVEPQTATTSKTAPASKAQTAYPGSPLLIQRLLRDHDKLKAFETHPTDSKALAATLEQLNVGRQVAMFAEDGFEGVKKFLPPPSRRALVLTDPSYEIKSDYAKVASMLADSVKRFATGTYAIWYPIIARAEAIDLPRKLSALAIKNSRAWLNASLTVKSPAPQVSAQFLEPGQHQRAGLAASGMFILNPPYTLLPALAAALPQLVGLLGQDRSATFTLDSSER